MKLGSLSVETFTHSQSVSALYDVWLQSYSGQMYHDSGCYTFLNFELTVMGNTAQKQTLEIK